MVDDRFDEPRAPGATIKRCLTAVSTYAASSASGHSTALRFKIACLHSWTVEGVHTFKNERMTFCRSRTGGSARLVAMRKFPTHNPNVACAQVDNGAAADCVISELPML